MSRFLKDSHRKHNMKLAHKIPACNGIPKDKTTRRREKQNSFSGSDFYAVIFFAAQRVI